MDDVFLEGVGSNFDLSKPFLLISQHPVTTEYGGGEDQIFQTLLAVRKIGLPAIVLWPNADAGSEDIARGIRVWRENNLADNMHFFKNLPTTTYIRLMKRTACLVGNSSSGIREGAFIGTPVVNVGSRQDMRERGVNVKNASNDATSIYEAIQEQLQHGPYKSESIYGDGAAGIKIANILSECTWKIQKQIVY
jgi:UDP-hydrolysing UDP-N-acetyl-D-glucosamine 2-epimerase